MKHRKLYLIGQTKIDADFILRPNNKSTTAQRSQI